jgi:pimeloyl-ACP methyl ester carboxylesterase
MYAELNGLRMFFEDRSKSDPTGLIVFLHGFPCDHSLWRYQLDYFSTRYRCLAPDLRGFGGTTELSKPDAAAALTIDTFADDVVALLDHLKLKKATFVGLSMGGYIALAIWRKHRKRVRRLVLSNTRAAGDTAETKDSRNRQAELITAQGTRAFADELLPRLLAPKNMARRGNEVRHMIERTRPETLVATIGALAGRKDMLDWLRRVHVKTLVVAGEEDAITHVSDAEVIKREIDHAKLVVIENSGHLSPLENPDAFNGAMFKFLK